ncbi:MAG: S8 family serine peptidase, partial [Chloroflexi bacterium]|nr:S8 family serine peptidase [Chloroflexota bacterium]
LQGARWLPPEELGPLAPAAYVADEETGPPSQGTEDRFERANAPAVAASAMQPPEPHAALSPQGGKANGADADDSEPGVLVVGLQPGATWQETAASLTPLGLAPQRMGTLPQLNLHKVRVPAGQEDSVLGLLNTLPSVAFAERNVRYYPQVMPHSPTAAPAAPVLAGPANAGTLTTFGPTLEWRAAAGATQYQIQVRPANDDGPSLNLIIGGTATAFRVPAPPEWYGMLPDMSYTWRVRLSDKAAFAPENDPTWGPWSEPWSFRTPSTAAADIQPVSPTVGAISDSLTPVLRWSNTNASIFYYEVQLSSDQTFATDPAKATASVYWLIIHGGITQPGNSYAVPAGFPLEPGKTYYWRVRPRVQGDGRPAPWPAPWSFRTGGTPAAAVTPTPAAPAAPIRTATPVPTAPPAANTFTGSAPNDTLYNRQWNLRRINAPGAWRITTGASTVIVGVIDSGADSTHPDLQGALMEGHSCLDDETAEDTEGHGTHVAGTINAKGNNGRGIAGMSWNTRLLPVKSLGESGGDT